MPSLEIEVQTTPSNEPKKKSKGKRILRGLFYSALTAGLTLFALDRSLHHECDPDYKGPKQRTEQLLSNYNYPEQDAVPKEEVIQKTKAYTIKRIEFPSAMDLIDRENVLVDYYEQNQDGKFPTILMLPILGGVDYSVTTFADYFSSRGFNCAIVHNKKIDEESRDAWYLESYMKQAVIDARQTLDYLEGQEKVNGEFGCFGISMGGIKTSLIAGVDERVKASVIIMGGGSMADIMCHSDEGYVRRPRQALLDQGITLEDIHREVSCNVDTDPLKLAPHIDARNTYMMLAYFDEAVPKFCGDQLWEAIGKPELDCMVTGHYSAVLYLPIAKPRAASFFKDHLGKE